MHFDLVIIGTGSGNSILGPEFADWRVAEVEKGVFGGTCLNVGCIPTKMFVHTADIASGATNGPRFGVDSELHGVRWTDVRDRIFGRIDPIASGGREYRTSHPDNRNVTVFEGVARFTGPKTLDIDVAGRTETITADRIVLAAGSRPIIPEIPGLAESGYHTSDDIMRLDAPPRRLVILGSGFIGAEFAHIFGSYGTEVTVVARSGALLRGEDTAISTRFTELAQRRWDVRLDRKTVQVERIGDNSVALHLEGPHGAETVAGDALLVAVGRQPNTDLLDVAATGVAVGPTGYVEVDDYQRTNVAGIYALGDISSEYQLKHVANHEARIVRYNLAHPDAPQAADHRFVPHAVFSSPQIASVGLTEAQAEARGVRFVTSEQEYAGIAYGWAMEDTTGFAKLIADPATG
ncbi:MAG TPA: mycothione reductase, partial [Pseudonocardiaceae bacterium]|nr:mycothione reductase [Pseudonocardiaceae bacterium]